MRSDAAFPSLVGAAVSIAVGAVLGTATYKLIAWALVGSGAPMSDAVAIASGSTLYSATFFAFPIVSSALGGACAANLSNGRPHLSALFAALLVLVWPTILFTAPIHEARIEAATLIAAFAVPSPGSSLGAHLCERLKSNA